MIGEKTMMAALFIYIAGFLLFIGVKTFQDQFVYVKVPVQSVEVKSVLQSLPFSTEVVDFTSDSHSVTNSRSEFLTATKQKPTLFKFQSVTCQNEPQASYPFCNDSLNFFRRTDDLINRLTVAEMIQQTSSIASGIPRLGINAYNWRSNCMHGWSKSGGNWTSDLHWTVFPAPIGLGATFDAGLLYTAGQITSDEGRALHNAMLQEFKGASTEAAGLNCFSPNVNLFRDPRWGRGQETYGEDPYLLSVLGVAYTRGLQEGKSAKYLKVAACAKHYAVHSGPEELRLGFVADVSMYDLYATYLPAFKSQVLAGKVAQMMPAYSGVRVAKFSEDGAPDCANKFLLKTVLREEFNAPNISVCSDNGGISFVYTPHKYVKTLEEAAAVSMNASTDIDLGHDRVFSTNLENATNDHRVDEQTIKDAVWRSFYLRMKLGDFDSPSKVAYQSIGKDHLDTSENQAANLEAAIKSIVLLKNEGGFLPLTPSSLKKIAIIGPNANSEQVLLSNYEGIPSKIITIQEGIANSLGSGVMISNASGCSNTTCPTKDGFSEAKKAAEDADCVVMVMGLDHHLEGEGHDRAAHSCESAKKYAIGLPGCQHELISYVEEFNNKIVLILLNGGPLTIPAEDQSDKIPAIIEAFYPGPLGGTAVAKVLFGEVSPAGRMPVTVVQSEDDLPPSVDYNMATDPGRTYRYLQKPALYPFGYGLSYTEFEYSNLVVSPASISPCSSIMVSVEVKNSGKLGSDEVVQVYLTTPKAPGANVNALYNLVGFNRVHINPGSTLEVKFAINPYLMSSVGPDGSRVIVPGSNYVVYAGNSSPQKSIGKMVHVIVLQGQFTVTGNVTDITNCSDNVPQCLAC